MRLGPRRDILRWRLASAPNKIRAERMVMLDLEALRHIHRFAQMAGQAAIEAGEEHTTATLREPASLLKRDQRLPGSCAASDRGTALTSEQVEQTELLVRQLE